MAFANTVPAPKDFGHRKTPPVAKASGDSKAMPTVMIMAYDWGTGAHAVVTDRLSQALQRKGCKVVIFTDEQTKARMEWVTSVNGKFTVISHEKLSSTTEKEFEAACIKYQPDVLMVEHYPMNNGRYEPAPFLQCINIAKSLNPAIQTHALIRDIADTKIINPQITPDTFDHFLIRGDEKIHSYAKHFSDDPTWQTIEADNKVHYVGYAADERAPKEKRPTKNNSVVVSLGGKNFSDDEKTYEAIIRAIQKLPADSPLYQKNWHLYVADELYSKLDDYAGRSGKKLTIHPFSQDFSRALQQADMVVCRAGMTAVEAIAQSVPALVIPRSSNYVKGEQEMRADALKQAASGRVICMSQEDAKHHENFKFFFEETYKLKASRHINTAPPFKLGGHENAADAIIAAFRGEEIGAAEAKAIAR